MGERRMSRLLGRGEIPNETAANALLSFAPAAQRCPNIDVENANSSVAVVMTYGYEQTEEERKNLGIVGCVEIMDLESKLNRERGEGSKGLMQWERTEILQI